MLEKLGEKIICFGGLGGDVMSLWKLCIIKLDPLVVDLIPEKRYGKLGKEAYEELWYWWLRE